LIGLCNATALIIVNGRADRDTRGKYTYLSDQGSSAIDYCLCPTEIFHRIQQFKINELIDSKHQPITVELRIEAPEGERKDIANESLEGWGEHEGTAYSWDNNLRTQFIQKLTDKTTELFLIGIQKYLTENDITAASNKLNKMYYSVGNMMQRQSIKHDKGNKHPWYESYSKQRG